ncbi:MAG: regulatory protein RecX [Solirubrobacteraceae bacterium]
MSEADRALALGCAYLNRRERTIAEMRTHLLCRGVAEPLVDETVRTLADQRLLDDERFARLFVADKRELEHWGGERIRRGLQARGIDRELVDAALAAAVDDGEPQTELDRALAVLRSRFPVPPADRRERERALGVLLRKGYESELALDALAAHARPT